MAKRGPSARERREARERQRRRNRRITIISLLAVGAVIIGILLVVSNAPAEAPIPEDLAERYEGIETTNTTNTDSFPGLGEGFPVLGSPNAPVRVVEYSSFSCPGCASFHDSVYPELVERVRQGQIKFAYVPLQTGSIPNANGAARTALCAGEQGKFWEMHDLLFDWHVRFGNTAFSGNRLRAGAEGLELDMDEFTSCFDSGRISELLDLALRQGVQSTPTVTVNGNQVDLALSSILQEIERAYAPFADREEPEPEATAESTPDEEMTAEPQETEEAAEETPEAEAEPTEEMAAETAEPTEEMAAETAEPTEEASDE